MKKLFISLPMAGKTKEEIIKKQNEIFIAAQKLLKEDLSLVETVIEDIPDNILPDNQGLYCLGRSLELMSGSDYVCFIEDYESARGCRIEYQCALNYSKTILIEKQGGVIYENSKSRC